MILEDDSSLNLLNRFDRNAVAENGDVQPRFIIEPKRVTNMDLKHGRSNFGTLPEEIQLCPLELRPLLKKTSSVEAKWSNYEMRAKLEQPKKIRIPRRPRQDIEAITETGNCNKTGDVYGNILGPTPDESILAGLQTVINLCGLIDDCKDDADLSPTTDTGSGHIYHKQDVPYPCTFETRMLATSSRQSTDDANETFMSAREYSSRKGFVARPYGSQNLDDSRTNIRSGVVEDMEILQELAASRDDSPRKAKTNNNSKRYDTDDNFNEILPCDVCPQCMKEIEHLQATKLVYDDVPDKPTPTKQPKSNKICVCDDVCTKPPPPEKAKTKPKKVKEKKETEKSKKIKEEDKKKPTKKKKSMPTEEKVDICPHYTNAIAEKRDSELKDKIVYQRTSQSVQPTTSTSGSKVVLIQPPLSGTPKPSLTKENKYIQQKTLSSEIATETTREVKTTEECIATKRACDTKICPNRKQKSTCCPSTGNKKDASEKSKLRDATCSPTTSKIIDCNICDECIKKVEDSGKDVVTAHRTATSSFRNKSSATFERSASLGDSGRNNVKPTETCACSTECIGGLQTTAYRDPLLKNLSTVQPSHSNNQTIRTQNFNGQTGSANRITSQTAGLRPSLVRPSSILYKSATSGSIEPQEIPSSSQGMHKISSEMQNISRIPSEMQTSPSELKPRSNKPSTNSSMYRKSSGNQAGSHISIIIEEEDMKPSNYQNVRSRRSSIIQPRSSESVRETSSDVEISETSFRPSKSLQDIKKDNSIFCNRSPYKTTNGEDMASKSVLSTKCFPPVEIPPTFSRASIIAGSQDLITYSPPCKPLKASGDRESSHNRSSHRPVPLRVPKSGTSSYVEQSYDRTRKDFRRSGMQIPTVQPVIGVCTSQCASGDKVLDVRYAVVKISVFEDYTTYEIMKSSTVKPKKIPNCVEGIFVTKR